MILSRRIHDNDHRDGFTKWPFMTTHTWGEYPQGTWLLEVNSKTEYSLCYGEIFLFTLSNADNRNKFLSGELQHSETSTRLVQRVESDATRNSRATVHWTSGRGSSFETGDSKEGSRGTIDSDVTTISEALGTSYRETSTRPLLSFKDHFYRRENSNVTVLYFADYSTTLRILDGLDLFTQLRSSFSTTNS